MRVRMLWTLMMVCGAGVSPALAAGLASPMPPVRFGAPLDAAVTVVPRHLTLALDPAALAEIAADRVASSAQTPVAPAFEYSDGYRRRARLHKLSSWLMLPAFGVEAYLEIGRAHV